MSDSPNPFRTAVLLPAAGKSERFRKTQSRKKVFTELAGQPIWWRTALHFVNRSDVELVVVAVSRDDREWFLNEYAYELKSFPIAVVVGGASRCETVENMLAEVPSDIPFVAVHDAARPLLTTSGLDDLFAAARESGAVIPALPVSSTVKRADADGVIECTVDRDRLWTAQTPQVFRQELLREAYRKRGDLEATDESGLVEAIGHPVRLVRGWPMNIKITEGEDLELAEAFLRLLDGRG